MSFSPSFIRAARMVVRASLVAFGLGTFPGAGINGLLGETFYSPVQPPPFPYAWQSSDPNAGVGKNSSAQESLAYSPFGPISPLVQLPPKPPALGEMLPTDSIEVPQPAIVLSLADFPNETFYMPYANLLYRRSLSEKRTQRIGEYLAARRRLVDELRGTLDNFKDRPSADRAAALALLATRQDGPLHALDAEAEAIRHDLTAGGLFTFTPTDSGQDLDLLASRNVSESTREHLLLWEAAQYSDGFSTDERFLLHEMAFEAEDRGATPYLTTIHPDLNRLQVTQMSIVLGAGNLEKSAPEKYLYFLPAPARIRLPENLPSQLDAKVKAFLAEKKRLKDELLAAIKRSYFLPRQRTERYSQLAEQQAPQFAALESLAEEIRTAMPDLPYPDKPDRSTLPEDLTRRVGAFGERKAEVQRELFGRLRTLSTEIPDTRFKIVREGDGLAIVPADSKAVSPPMLAEFNANLARRYTGLAQESVVLRQEIQRMTLADPQYGAHTVAQLAAEFGRAYTAQENWNRYHDYFVAVLEPGLSPAQRRLLFAATISDFARAGYLSLF